MTGEVEVAQAHLPGLGAIAEFVLPQSGGPHLLPGLLTQQLRRAAQLGVHEGGEVRGRDGQRSGREVAHELEGDLLTRGGVARAQRAGQSRGQGLLIGGGSHARRLQDVLTHIGLEGLTAHPLHDVTGQGHPVVGVARGSARRKDLHRWIGLDVGFQVRLILSDSHALLEARRVGQQVTQGQGLIEAPFDLEVEVGADVGIEVHLALLHQLHGRDGGRDLGDRGHPEQGRLRVHGHRLSAGGARVGPAVAAGGHHLSVLDHGHHGTGDVAVLEGIGQLPVQPGIDILGRELMLPRRRLTRRQTGRRRRRAAGGQ